MTKIKATPDDWNAVLMHWEEILLLVASGRTWDLPIFSEDCQFCRRFRNQVTNTCYHCPIFEETGAHGCVDSPWLELQRHAPIYQPKPIYVFYGEENESPRVRKLTRGVIDELRFLYKLRHNEES